VSTEGGGMRSFLRLLCAIGATTALFVGSYPAIVVAASFAQIAACLSSASALHAFRVGALCTR
jgi:hypothetical protein